ncbi:hypothetical protein AU255_06400 [Methyloprofundus sedimenti]|uniref:Thioredoxin n=1 Tax=Methyloprofundus sedimenti TaxID=1420851 RepID=A0A1V8M7J5_9GAMM|nr:DUF255 domain-containing protein [Methyloprofundus sedimenti]OQK17502.1 hypothetical protein AU255_06400 [Methyloprofundus sedimenti]
MFSFKHKLSIFILVGSIYSTGAVAKMQYFPPEMQSELHAAYIAKGKDYQPRSANLLDNGQPAYINQLILQDSPYLIQHAHNPVHWYPWGEDAFARAKRENKPVFLSIGYSTCHWCHVMEEESFDNPAIAAVLNQHFIAIKVDRECRPDIDTVYMQAITLLTGRGGWPMSSFLTPEGKTFLGDSYFPPEPFKELLLRVNDAWQQQQALVLQRADAIAKAVASTQENNQQSQTLDSALFKQTAENLFSVQDRKYGGFGQNMKFPNETLLMYLCDDYQRYDNKQSLAVVEASIQAMAQGGIYDQVGGGFHRYATDRQWQVPHFEKMLYNQAQLAQVYLLAYQLTGKAEYARIAQQTLDYVLNDMRAKEGGFYSATDADSNGVEGEFFVWTPEQIKKALSPELAERAIDVYAITSQGNFEGHNILHLPLSLESYAEKNDLSLPLLLLEIEQIRQGLKQKRQQRIAPLRDDKIVTAWNAMMIESLALAAEVLQQPEYLIAAEKAANWLWQNNRQSSGKFWRIHWQGSSSVNANQQDYAFFVSALIKLYDQTGDQQWFDKAEQLTDIMIKQFWDKKDYGFFMNSGAETQSMMLRPKDIQDNALPSANAVAVHVLAQLSKRTPNPEYPDKAAAALAAFSAKVTAEPTSYTRLLSAAAGLNYAQVGSIQYAAKGAVTLRAKRMADNQLQVILSVKPGWHINAQKPLQDYLIPTKISLPNNELDKVIYPPAILKKLSFGQQKLALYENQLTVQATLPETLKDNPYIHIQIQLQACNDKHCLAPEILTLGVARFIN